MKDKLPKWYYDLEKADCSESITKYLELCNNNGVNSNKKTELMRELVKHDVFILTNQDAMNILDGYKDIGKFYYNDSLMNCGIDNRLKKDSYKKFKGYRNLIGYFCVSNHNHDNYPFLIMGNGVTTKLIDIYKNIEKKDKSYFIMYGYNEDLDMCVFFKDTYTTFDWCNKTKLDKDFKDFKEFVKDEKEKEFSVEKEFPENEEFFDDTFGI